MGPGNSARRGSVANSSCSVAATERSTLLLPGLSRCVGESTYRRRLYGSRERIRRFKSEVRRRDDDAGGHIFPESDKQLSRQRHDRRFAQAAAVALYAVVEPESERRVRLMPQP